MWDIQVRRIHKSEFYRQVSSPPAGRIEHSSAGISNGEVVIDDSWVLDTIGDFTSHGPGAIGLDDLRGILESNFGVRMRRGTPGTGTPVIRFELCPEVRPASSWLRQFDLHVSPCFVHIRGNSEETLLRASLYLTNYWRLRRAPVLTIGKRKVKPEIPLHIGADLWGGFSTTQAWIPGRESQTNFLELARMGVNLLPIMMLLEDTIDHPSQPEFSSLHNPNAAAYRKRLAALAQQAARYDVRIMLMGYNPKLDPNHAVFNRYPACSGALQAGGAFRVLCTSDQTTREFLAESWASLFKEIPELGGLEAISGGEGFYHCYMNSIDPVRNPLVYPDLPVNTARDCPRCSARPAADVVAEFINTVARAIHARQPEACVVTWPYQAQYYWSTDRDQTQFIRQLDPDHVIFQTELDKDYLEWRPPGYAKTNWDYNLSSITMSPRSKAQRKLCRQQRLPFSAKLESNVAIECLNVPYLPILENQRIRWEQCRAMKPAAMHSRWLFDFSLKAPPEELGYWASWGKNTEFHDLDRVLTAMAERDHGKAAAPAVRKAWRLFSEAMRHHPSLDYYIGSYFIGPGQPLVLDPNDLTGLDEAFFGCFYWQWERSATNDDTLFVKKKPLFYSKPGFKAIVRRGVNNGKDVGLDELQALASGWEQGLRVLAGARAKVPAECKKMFNDLWVLSQYLAYTWRSAANVEEFLRLRDIIRGNTLLKYRMSAEVKVNMRDVTRMEKIARDELRIAKASLILTRGVDALDLSLRLDMGVSSTDKMLTAKIKQVEKLLLHDLPAWRKKLLTW